MDKYIRLDTTCRMFSLTYPETPKKTSWNSLLEGEKKKALFTLLQDCQRKGRDKECYQYFRTTDMTSNF